MRIISLISILLFTGNAARGQNLLEKNSSWVLHAGFFQYNSYSQEKISFPMNMGYPVIYTSTSDFGVSYINREKKTWHKLGAEILMPSKLNSDNGSGQNLLLDRDNSRYFRFSLNYKASWKLFQTGSLRINHGAASGILSGYRKLTYKSNASEITSDWNLFLGPALEAFFIINDEWCLSGDFDARFYLPYLNRGTLKKSDTYDNEIYSSAYSGFYYQTLFGLSLAYRKLMISLVKNDIVGYASPEPGFKTENIVHFKLERIYLLKLSWQL